MLHHVHTRLRPALLAALMAYTGARGFAQDAVATNKAPELSPSSLQATAVTVPRRLPESIGPAQPAVPPGQVEMGGAIPKVARSRKPWQMLNPFAPKEYGNGTDVLARNPVTGEAEGVTFLSFTCPEQTNKPKTKKKPAAK